MRYLFTITLCNHYIPTKPAFMANRNRNSRRHSPTFSPQSRTHSPQSPTYSPTSPAYSPPESPLHFERKLQQLRSSKRKIRAIEDSDGDSSLYRSKKTRSMDAKSPSETKKHRSEYDRSYNSPQTPTGKPLTDDEDAEYGPYGYKYNSKEEKSPIPESEHQISNPRASNRNHWIAECDHAAAFLKFPISTARSTGKPDLSNPREQYAQPLVRAAWAGEIKVSCGAGDLVYDLRGCVSSKASAQTRSEVEQMPAWMEFERLSKWRVWPESFEQRGPTDDDIVVFFFPSLRKYESAYESLVIDLIRDDLALRTTVNGSELLVFTSVDLPPLFTRFQGKLYLWGFFRGNQPASSV